MVYLHLEKHISRIELIWSCFMFKEYSLTFLLSDCIAVKEIKFKVHNKTYFKLSLSYIS